MPIVETIPNLSEGRRPEVVEPIVGRAARVPGASVLGWESDPDHHRSVVTIAGTPRGVVEAVLALAAGAVEGIDLSHHEGVHPRIGALDVVPFVPIEGIDLAGCRDLARMAGSRLADELGLPVFLYATSATRPERRELADIRRGGPAGLARRIEGGEPWVPDYGPATLHPTAGAVAVGARDFLVAYNVELRTGDLEVAKRIASAVRESGGGLPGVRALGLATETRGVVQVSMNLVDLETTGVDAAFERVAGLAAEAGVEVLGGELVGFVPRAAVEGSFGRAFAHRGFDRDKVLETRLEGLRPPERGGLAFLDALGSTAPTPGGGGAAAMTGATAAALAEKAARISAAKARKRSEGADTDEVADEVADEGGDENAGTGAGASAPDLALSLEERAERSLDLRQRLAALAESDAMAFRALLAAYRTGDAEAIRAATADAARPPVEIAERLAELAGVVAHLRNKAHPHIASDVACAAAIARGALEAASATARVNLDTLPADDLRRTALEERLATAVTVFSDDATSDASDDPTSPRDRS